MNTDEEHELEHLRSWNARLLLALDVVLWVLDAGLRGELTDDEQAMVRDWINAHDATIEDLEQWFIARRKARYSES
jgi:hypothetical protein